jgi:hypothetical protein
MAARLGKAAQQRDDRDTLAARLANCLPSRYKVRVSVACCCLLIVGCTWPVQMMPRDAGTVYRGVANGNGMGSGTMSVDIDGRLYSGPMFRTASSDVFGFFQAYSGTKSAFGTSQTFGGSVAVKAILSSPGNHGLRCDMMGDGRGHGGGICVDDQGRVFDILVGS